MDLYLNTIFESNECLYIRTEGVKYCMDTRINFKKKEKLAKVP